MQCLKSSTFSILDAFDNGYPSIRMIIVVIYKLLQISHDKNKKITVKLCTSLWLGRNVSDKRNHSPRIGKQARDRNYDMSRILKSYDSGNYFFKTDPRPNN